MLFGAAGALHAAGAPLAECRVSGIRNSVLCGVVPRPLDPAHPEGVMIDVHYVVVPAMARRKLPDPVFVFAGGPGQSAIGIAPSTLPLFGRLNNRRDIVFIDQRGTGRSAPLACDDPTHESLAEQADPNRPFARMMECKAALMKLPHARTPSDLGLFTTTIAMQDFDAVRRQLGAERINLVGVSYGTRAALEYMRQFPAAVRRSVLDAVAPPDMALPDSFSTDGQAAWDALLRSCELEVACHRRHPTLRRDWAALLDSLPKPVTVAHPMTGTPEHFQLTREMVLGAVRGALYSPAVAAALPVAITESARGRFDGLVGLGALLASRKSLQPALGMHFSVVCAEDVPRLAEVGRPPSAGSDGTLPHNPPGGDFRTEQAEMYLKVCTHWPRGDVPAAFYRVPPSTVPTLLLSGGIDPVTPPRHGQRVANALGPSARHVVVPHAGHGVMAIGCARDVIYRFIDADDDREATRVDASCLAGIPRPPAFTPVGAPMEAVK
jgi:pimeloyl-ACP methyl ester carboxylesterase